ncbi:MAG: PAS domain S-box protein [Deltaproteobacteria bacterium]|nr:PAS domain S-box protein [Deltaproteobacteria bacterium]
MPPSIKDKVKALEKTNRLITDNLVDAVWVIDAETLKYEYITPSIQKISGYSSEALIDTVVFDRLTPESSEYMKAVLFEGLKEHETGQQDSRSIELELVRKSGDTYWVEVRAKLAKEYGGRPKIIGITRDITTRKRAEVQLERLNQELLAALADKDQLLKEIKVLHKLLPICSGCRRIRDDEGKWWPLEEYVRVHTDSDFTHTICPDCKDIYYPDIKK